MTLLATSGCLYFIMPTFSSSRPLHDRSAKPAAATASKCNESIYDKLYSRPAAHSHLAQSKDLVQVQDHHVHVQGRTLKET